MCLTYRDADETKEWIEEKNQALNTDNYGHDLASVQALQRKHEGFERDLAALGDKVRACGWGAASPRFRPRLSPLLSRCSPLSSPGEFPWRNSRAPDPGPPRVGSGPAGEVRRVEPGVEQPGQARRPAQGQAGPFPRPAALPQRLPVRSRLAGSGPGAFLAGLNACLDLALTRLNPGNSLAAQWLGLGTFTPGSPGSITGWGTEIPQATQQKNKKKTHLILKKSICV